jgi:hypothetical protein
VRRFLAGSLVLNAVLLTALWWRIPLPRAEGAGNDGCSIALGNVNGDLHVDLSDAIYLIDYVFLRGPAPTPSVAVDAQCYSHLADDLATCQASLDQCTTAVPVEPRSPSGLAATPGDTRVTIRWTDSVEPEAASYSAYRSTMTGGDYIRIAGNLPHASFVDGSVSNDTTYYYVVTAVSAGGAESPFSGEVEVTPVAARSPCDPPPGSITLEWSTPTLNSDGTPCIDLSGFKVYWGTASGQYTFSKDVGNAVVATIADLVPGNYYFTISAYDASGNESGLADELVETIE